MAKSPSVTVTFDDSESTEHRRDERGNHYINFQRNRDGSYIEEIPVIKSRSSITMEDGVSRDVVLIGKGKSPFYLTVAHELIHFLHDIESPDLMEKRRRITYDRVPTRRLSEIWRDREEHKTVFSAADISEMKLRLEAREPLRYIYQNADTPFYEPVKTVLGNAIKAEYLIDTEQNSEVKIDDMISSLIDLQNAINKLPQYNFSRELGVDSISYTKSKLIPHFTKIKQLLDNDKIRWLDMEGAKLQRCSKALPWGELKSNPSRTERQGYGQAKLSNFDKMISSVLQDQGSKVGKARNEIQNSDFKERAVIPGLLAKAIKNGHLGAGDLYRRSPSTTDPLIMRLKAALRAKLCDV
jgi:hypothetical protein